MLVFVACNPVQRPRRSARAQVARLHGDTVNPVGQDFRPQESRVVGQHIIQGRHRWKEHDPGRRRLYEIRRLVRLWVEALATGTIEQKRDAEVMLSSLAPRDQAAVVPLIESLRIEDVWVRIVVGRALNRLIGKDGPHAQVLVMRQRQGDTEYLMFANETWISHKVQSEGDV
jgi:hypothetical protein